MNFINSFSKRTKSILSSLTNLKVTTKKYHTLLFSCRAGDVAITVTERNENEVAFPSTFIAWKPDFCSSSVRSFVFD